MTIPDQIPRVVSTADGVATEYSYHFYAPDPSHVFVASNGALVTSGWQAVKTSDDDGYVKFNTAPASGVELTIYRSTPMTQETVWSNGEAFYADTLTSAADKLTMIAQELRGGTVNVPGTVTSAQWASSARIASSATNAGSATRAVSATSAVYATSAVSATKAGSAAYHGPFEATRGGASGGYVYYGVSGGKVCVNGSNYEVASGQVSAVQGTEPTVYLVGSSAAGSAPTFSFTTTEPTSSAGQFYAPIANFVEGGAVQVQFGNIVDTNWGAGGGGGGDVNYASSAGVASNLTASAAEEIVSAAIASAGIEAAIVNGSATVTLTGGTGAVVFKGAGAATITSGSAGEVVISAAGGGGAASVPMVLYGAGSSLSVGSGNSHFNYTTSPGDPGGRTTVGTGLGGVILGTAKMPLESDESDTIEIYLSTGEYGTSHTLLTGIDTHGPRNAFISIPLGPDTDFSLEAYGTYATTTAEYNLVFYPYSFNN